MCYPVTVRGNCKQEYYCILLNITDVETTDGSPASVNQSLSYHGGAEAQASDPLLQPAWVPSWVCFVSGHTGPWMHCLHPLLLT